MTATTAAARPQYNDVWRQNMKTAIPSTSEATRCECGDDHETAARSDYAGERSDSDPDEKYPTPRACADDVDTCGTHAERGMRCRSNTGSSRCTSELPLARPRAHDPDSKPSDGFFEGDDLRARVHERSLTRTSML